MGCFLFFHNWQKWGPFSWNENIQYIDSNKQFNLKYDGQCRYCKKCGIMQKRRVR